MNAGSFYMWMRDSNSSGLSISAFSLSDLFRSLNEAKPTQSNVIIDACESGGLISDLGVLLKKEIVGDAGTQGITLVATSAQDQLAGETAAGGLGTNAILDCIEGREFVQDYNGALDLVEIGRHVSTHLREDGQSPVVWGLNLYGAPRFCRNPRYSLDPARPLREIVNTWPVDSDNAVRANFDQLWHAYISVSSDDWEPRVFADVVTTIISPLAATPEALANFTERFGAAVLERAQLSQDAFRPAQVAACLAACLLPHLEQDAIAHHARRMMETTGSAILTAGSILQTELADDRFALLAKNSRGLSELFYLPLRISKVLGWTAAASWLFEPDNPRHDEAEYLFTSLLRELLEQYPLSMTTITDAQAPYTAIALSKAAEIGLKLEAEQMTGLLFRSLLACRGNIARMDIPADMTLNYLQARNSDNYEHVADLIERPIEMLTVLLRACLALGLEDVFDECLWEIDGTTLSAYLSADFSQYGSKRMTVGKNISWTIGYSIFRVADIGQTWPNNPPQPIGFLQTAGALLGSLLYPDRVPWFCFDADIST